MIKKKFTSILNLRKRKEAKNVVIQIQMIDTCIYVKIVQEKTIKYKSESKNRGTRNQYE